MMTNPGRLEYTLMVSTVNGISKSYRKARLISGERADPIAPLEGPFSAFQGLLRQC